MEMLPRLICAPPNRSAARGIVQKENQITYRRLATIVLAGLWAPLMWLIVLMALTGGVQFNTHFFLTVIHPLYGLLPMSSLWIAGTWMSYKTSKWMHNRVERSSIITLAVLMHLGLGILICVAGLLVVLANFS